jgi:hypothetical protein
VNQAGQTAADPTNAGNSAQASAAGELNAHSPAQDAGNGAQAATDGWKQYGETPEVAASKMAELLQTQSSSFSQLDSRLKAMEARDEGQRELINQQAEELGQRRGAEKTAQYTRETAEKWQNLLLDTQNPESALAAGMQMAEHVAGHLRQEENDRRLAFGKVRRRDPKFDGISYDDVIEHALSNRIDIRVLTAGNQMEGLLRNIAASRAAIFDPQAEREKIRKEERARLEKENAAVGGAQRGGAANRSGASGGNGDANDPEAAMMANLLNLAGTAVR